MKELISAFRESVIQSGLMLELTPTYILLTMLVALACAAMIALVYKFFYRGACYSANFTVLLVMTTLVTTFALITVSANLVLSLGMVGALSIVRFRAAVKDPLDIGFLFWSIAVGITCGAGLFVYALVCSFFIAAVYVILTVVRFGPNSYLLVIRHESSCAGEVAVELSGIRTRLKNRTVTGSTVEISYKVYLKGEQAGIVDRLNAINGVSRAMLIEYTGDI